MIWHLDRRAPVLGPRGALRSWIRLSGMWRQASSAKGICVIGAKGRGSDPGIFPFPFPIPHSPSGCCKAPRS